MKKALQGVSLSLALLSTALVTVYAQQGVVISQQTVANGNALIKLLELAQDLVARLGFFAVGVAVLAFFWYLIQFILNPGDGEKRSEKLRGMMVSILALFVMVSIWGIIGLLGSIFGIGQGGSVPVPTVPVPVTR